MDIDRVEKLIRPGLATMHGYDPIEPIDVLERELGKRIVKLDGNENPYMSSPRARDVLAHFPYYHIYPDPLQRNLREALSVYTGFPPDCIVAANGSDEIIDLVLRLFVREGQEVLNFPPTFGMYPFLVTVCGGMLVNVPRKSDFSLDVAAARAAVTPKSRVAFVASPNNPTGGAASEDEVRALLAMGLIVAVDEAYFEFSSGTVAGLVPQNPSLIVLRTFSKWAGLAGLRVGYCLCHERLAGHFLTIKQPYNVNVAGEAAAIASLKDVDYLKANVGKLRKERERLFAALSAIPWLDVYPSQANFLLCRVKENRAGGRVATAKTVRDGLRRRGILVRFYESAALRDCLRISVGLPEDTDALLAGMEEVWNEA
ncbi:MAG: histidinol-phosphate transaminase [Dehalococcoidia bacterium]|nr:histidinol-phosphate transaminase [Dehalococcoidia bacterium]